MKFFLPVSEPVDDQQRQGGFDGRMKSNRAMKTATVASVTYLNVQDIKHQKVILLFQYFWNNTCIHTLVKYEYTYFYRFILITNMVSDFDKLQFCKKFIDLSL